ncbi:hypothetical protein [Breoghania sp. L-A4]|uniref:hypothetical protein n=1 Tax=Breoghania sp. L-A4 TaxID=2304600 RepID=UPI000E3587F8|nr:hypothetical protein [Breoghania sp. L-A4]AXS41930.1 hypothetical protein D1F64_20365 [Breoghania sp. L-A4]
MKHEDIKTFAARPAPQACKLMDFDKAQVHPGFLPNTFILIVSGDKPSTNIEITLRPLVYVKQPEYWGFEVIGCITGIGLPVVTPYTEAADIGSNRGTKGIEVIGANKTLQIAVP